MNCALWFWVLIGWHRNLLTVGNAPIILHHNERRSNATYTTVLLCLSATNQSHVSKATNKGCSRTELGVWEVRVKTPKNVFLRRKTSFFEERRFSWKKSVFLRIKTFFLGFLHWPVWGQWSRLAVCLLISGGGCCKHGRDKVHVRVEIGSDQQATIVRT